MAILLGKKHFGLLMCCLGFFFFSCAAMPNAYRPVDEAVGQQDFERGIALIESRQEGQPPLYPENNAVSLFMDKGLLEYYAGKYKDSAQSLLEAERLIEEAFTKSVTAEIGSYIANDNTKEYPGEDFEDIYINVFNALSFYQQGNIESALVEIRRLYMPNGKLDMLSRKYEGKGQSAGDYVLEQLGKIGLSINPDLPQGSSVNFSNSALARYLAALFLLAAGNPDIRPDLEFAQVAAAFADNPNVYRHPIPGAVAEAQSVPAGKARLNVIAFAGLSPVKEEETFAQLFPFFKNAALQQPVFRLPRFVDRPSGINRIEVAVDGERFDLELLEDMGEVMKEAYNARFGNLFFKTYIRVLLKYAAADVAATAAGNSKGGALAANAAAIAGKAAADASEGADIRMSRYLPGRAYIGGINLDPGNYTLTVSYYSGSRVIARTEHADVAVRAGALNLINSVGLGNEMEGHPSGGARTARIASTSAVVLERFTPVEMVRINGGTFTMGSPANEPGRRDREGPQRQVTVSSFTMEKYEVTQRKYQEEMRTNPSHFKGDNLPVEQVSWYDAIEYCNRRSQREGLTPAYTVNGRNVTWNRDADGYRLPTEAEWEYACRAGTMTAYNTGASINDITGWYSANSDRKTHPVGQKPANAWGLHDMHGNVWEWCWDWYGTYSDDSTQTDPTGASSGINRVVRGGSWYSFTGFVRSACRPSNIPSARLNNLGFRLVRN